MPPLGAQVALDDFSDVSSLTLNGSAGALTPNARGVLELTDTLDQKGSAYTTSTVSLPPNGSFSTHFAFQLSDPEGISDEDGMGADGMAFVLQAVGNSALSSESGGNGLGFAGLVPSLAVEYDTWNAGFSDDFDGNHVGVDLNGDVDSVVQVSVPSRLNDGTIWFSWIDYDGDAGLLEMRLSENPSRPADPTLSFPGLDLPGLLGTTEVFAGFTAGTGGAANDQDVLYWHLTAAYSPIELDVRFAERAAARVCPEGNVLMTITGDGSGDGAESITVTELLVAESLDDLDVLDVSSGGVVEATTSPDRTEPSVTIFPERVFVGFDCLGGSDTTDNGDGTYTSTSTSGGDIWENGDDFEFRYAAVSGDFDISVELTDYSHSSGLGRWGKFGLMARRTDGDPASERFARFTMMEANGPSNVDQAKVLSRLLHDTPGPLTMAETDVPGTPGSRPRFLRLTRRGSEIQGWASNRSGLGDGTLNPCNDGNWLPGRADDWGIDIPDTLLVGLANSDHIDFGCDSQTMKFRPLACVSGLPEPIVRKQITWDITRAELNSGLSYSLGYAPTGAVSFAGGVSGLGITLITGIQSVVFDHADGDGDGRETQCDNCPNAPNADQADGDGDGVGDACDNCPAVSNPDQEDSDSVSQNARVAYINSCGCCVDFLFGLGHTVTYFFDPFGLTAADLAGFDVALVASNCQFTDGTNIGDVLKEFSDAGGGVVLTQFDFQASAPLSGGIMSPGYSPFTVDPGFDYFIFSGLGTIHDSASPLLAGVNTSNVFTNYQANTGLDPGATLVADWSTGRHAIAFNRRGSGAVVGLNLFPPDAFTADTQRLIANAIGFSAGGDGLGDACDPDDDDDGLLDGNDNCPTVQNPGQENADGDALGDACDPDDDGDGRDDGADNCPLAANPGQEDSDFDGAGDACDICAGFSDFAHCDGDAIPDGCDNCACTDNADQSDADGDGVGDVCDNCPATGNTDQADGDFDGVGSVCDGCPLAYNPGQEDSDGDGVQDACDNCPADANPGQEESEGGGALETLALEIFDTGCFSGNAYEIYLNGTLLAFIEESPTCDCFPGIRSFPVTDPGALAAWNASGDNFFRVVKYGCGALFTWARAQVQVGGLNSTICLVDAQGTGCTTTYICNNYFFCDLDQSVTVPRGDGVGDACDRCPGQDDRLDRDFDGIPDGCDNCPDAYNPDQGDSDGDGVGDVCDNCVDVANADQSDVDGDGAGDACDRCAAYNDFDDADGDGSPDCLDNCPLVFNSGQEDANADGVGDACPAAVSKAIVNGPASSGRGRLGMVADNSTRTVTVFDALTDTVLGSVFIGFQGSALGDCMISKDGSRGFVTNFGFQVWVIDLTTSPPSLASGNNPISISNFGEDLALSADGKFLLVSDGSAFQPIGVIDVALQAEVSTFFLGHDCNSLDVASDGSVITTSWTGGSVRRLLLDAAGNLSDTGEALFIGSFQPMNVYLAPDGKSGVVVTGSPDQVHSFTVPGLALVSTRALSGFNGISGAFSPSGDRFFARSNNFVDSFSFDPLTGTLGASPLFSFAIAGAPAFFGMDQLAIHPNGDQLYVPQPFALNVHDPDTGSPLATLTGPDIGFQPTGVAIGGALIDQVVQIGKPTSTEYSFRINYTNPVFSPVVILDTVPAEWQVVEVAGSPITNGFSSGYIPDDDGTGLAEAFPASGKPDNKSATRIFWYPARYGSFIRPQATLTVKVRTRQHTGTPPKFTPTACGRLLLNSGALVYEITPSLVAPVNRKAVTDFLKNRSALAASILLCLAAVTDCNGDGVIRFDGMGDEDTDGLTDLYEACTLRTDPCKVDTDGDGARDSADAFPLDYRRW